MTDILLVEDNQELSQILRDFLAVSGYEVVVANTGEAALEAFDKMNARLVILDIMLPGIDGFSVCQQLRKQGNVPIIIVSAKTEKEDKLNGLLLGSDDYMEKPYDIDIMLAKIQGIFARRYETSVIVDGNLRIDPQTHVVSNGEQKLSLTIKEYELLLLLVQNKGKTLRKEYLFDKIWGQDSFSEPQTLTVHIKWLRQKIELDPKNPARILTVWGTGYRFE